MLGATTCQETVFTNLYGQKNNLCCKNSENWQLQRFHEDRKVIHAWNCWNIRNQPFLLARNLQSYSARAVSKSPTIIPSKKPIKNLTPLIPKISDLHIQPIIKLLDSSTVAIGHLKPAIFVFLQFWHGRSWRTNKRCPDTPEDGEDRCYGTTVKIQGHDISMISERHGCKTVSASGFPRILRKWIKNS